jgi:hypothetical protein
VTAVAIALAAALASTVWLVAWLTYRVVATSERDGDSRVAQVATEAVAERTAFELDVTLKALAAANKRADALEEIISDELNAMSPNADLTRIDVRSRLVRLASKWREAAAARNSLPAQPDPAVPEDGTASGSGPTVVSPDGLPDV